MSSANLVPETHTLTGHTAFDTLRRARFGPLLRDSVARLRYADGLSHSRAMAYQLVLALIPGAIVLIGLAAELKWDSLSSSIVSTTQSLAPGPAGDVFADALGQGAEAEESSSGWTALAFGSLALVIAGTTLFGQVERTANRIYGIEADRPTRQKYTRALLMLVTAGALLVGYFLLIGLGGGWTESIEDSAWGSVWKVARWPLAAIVLGAGFALILKLSPRRRQPGLSWLAFGGLLGVLLSMAVSVLLHVYLNSSGGFGDTYGPLAGFIGVLLWSYASSIALFLGLAFAAQLEAVRAGVADPRSEAKLFVSEPDAATISYGTAVLTPD